MQMSQVSCPIIGRVSLMIDDAPDKLSSFDRCRSVFLQDVQRGFEFDMDIDELKPFIGIGVRAVGELSWVWS